MHSNSHPNGAYYAQTTRLHNGRIVHVYETCYETRREAYRVLDIPALGERHLILRCERVAPANAKGFGWQRAIAAADDATTHDRNRNGFWGPIVEQRDHAHA